MSQLAGRFAEGLMKLGKKVHPAGPGKYECQCPAHDDRAASLSIGTGDDGRLLARCHAGCVFGNIIAAAGWTMAECFPPKSARVPPRNGNAVKAAKNWPTIQGAIEAARRSVSKKMEIPLDVVLYSQHWLYQDGGGADVAAVVRFDLPTPAGEKQSKTFRPLHRAGGGWAQGDPPERWPLYRLPELLAAIKRGESRVYLVEGEKTADAAVACGLVATTSAHGSQSPGKTDWTPLAEVAEIVILPDADLPNHKTGKIAGEQFVLLAAAQILAVTR